MTRSPLGVIIPGNTDCPIMPERGGITTSMSIYIYEAFFRAGDIGRALAASILLFLTAFALLWAIGRLTRRAT